MFRLRPKEIGFG
ncbi:hypothetical protein F383_29865 [Gossypium arboreum]|uniref:Uncharacterized protein n=1 Tax=Gossypium arboreum TaxID=29729 RepID=A0A0B0PGU3_GOSAR|nr:hypothetical protein F383_29865 [Gossypium arboreum]